MRLRREAECGAEKGESSLGTGEVGAEYQSGQRNITSNETTTTKGDGCFFIEGGNYRAIKGFEQRHQGSTDLDDLTTSSLSPLSSSPTLTHITPTSS